MTYEQQRCLLLKIEFTSGSFFSKLYDQQRNIKLEGNPCVLLWLVFSVVVFEAGGSALKASTHLTLIGQF